uniref:Uncharacterized protein n=1 Tax=Aegilops tauschii subsp. strangulata TaxID=200361 RepID=A0A453MGY9_AEGTS
LLYTSRCDIFLSSFTSSASIGAHASSSQLNFALNPMDYEHESVMRNPESHAIGGHADVLQTNQGHRFQNPNLRVEGESISSILNMTLSRMDAAGMLQNLSTQNKDQNMDKMKDDSDRSDCLNSPEQTQPRWFD